MGDQSSGERLASAIHAVLGNVLVAKFAEAAG